MVILPPDNIVLHGQRKITFCRYLVGQPKLYLYKLDPLVWGPPGLRTGGSNLYKTRKVMWPHLDDMLDHIRTFLSIIIIWLSMSRDGHIALKGFITKHNILYLQFIYFTICISLLEFPRRVLSRITFWFIVLSAEIKCIFWHW